MEWRIYEFNPNSFPLFSVLALNMNMNFKKKPRAPPGSGRAILFTNARDEPNMVEWAVHHLLLGFYTIIIFDHLSKRPIREQFIRKTPQTPQWLDARIQVIPISWDNPVKLRLMQLAVEFAKKRNYDWMLYLDADEYLCLPRYRGVPHLLSKCVGVDELAVNWVMFGTNYLETTPAVPAEYHGRFQQEQGAGILSHFTKSRPNLDQHVKSFVRPHAVKHVSSPHFWHIYEPHRMATLHKMPMRSPYYWDKMGERIPVSQAWGYVAHYVHQSRESYLSRKIKLPTDDTGGMRGDISHEIHTLYNEIPNTQVKDLYLQNIENFLVSKGC